MLPTTPQLPVLFPDQAARMNRKGRSMTGTQVVPIDYYAATTADPAERVHQQWFQERAAEIGTQLRENTRKDSYMRKTGGPSRLGAVATTALIGGVITDPSVRPQIGKLLQRRKAEYEQLATAAVDAPSAPGLPQIPLQEAAITGIDGSIGVITDALASLAVDAGIVSETRKIVSNLLNAAQFVTPTQLQNYYVALEDAEVDAAAIAGRAAGPAAVTSDKKRILLQFIREVKKARKVIEQLARAVYSSGADRQLMVENIRRQQNVPAAVGSTLELGVPTVADRPILAPQPTGQGKRYKKKVQ